VRRQLAGRRAPKFEVSNSEFRIEKREAVPFLIFCIRYSQFELSVAPASRRRTGRQAGGAPKRRHRRFMG